MHVFSSVKVPLYYDLTKFTYYAVYFHVVCTVHHPKICI